MHRGFLSKTKADAAYPMVELDSESDGEDSLSSEDEIDAFLNGSFKHKQHVHHQQSSSEDEFEKEMAEELDQRMANIEGLHKGTKKKMMISTAKKKKEPDQKRYEDEFLDSIDKSDDEDSAGLVNQVPMTNDDLLYDPDMDDEDQKWVDQQRQKCQPKPSKNATKSPGKKKNGSSDSTLSCPACMSFLCRDCQRHSIYKNQFRAMFVTNCTIDDTERLRYPKEGQKNNKNKKNKNKKQKTEESTSEKAANTSASSASFHPGDDNDNDDSYHPVRCSVCTTEVGVYDKDEVYHFFNVIESNG